mmetsp:Transcript_9771/g.20274  ORF Transcript_9771/g.20274 Transcript_9771/m.20274 type:complete len:202 (-) Transcript_9771:402-1007(-)
MGNFSAGRNLLAIECLFGTNVGRPRPNVLGASHVGVACQVSQQPKCWPQTTNVTFSRQLNLGFHNATSETKLVPRLQHGRFEMLGFTNLLFRIFFVFPNDIGIFGLSFNDELSIFVRFSIRGRIIVKGVVGVIVFLECGPSWIASVFKGSLGNIELLRKDELMRIRCAGGIRRRSSCWSCRGFRSTSGWRRGPMFGMLRRF